MKRIATLIGAAALALAAVLAPASDWTFARESHPATGYTNTVTEWSNWQLAALKAASLASATNNTATNVVCGVTYADGSAETLCTLTNGATWRPGSPVYLTAGDVFWQRGSDCKLTNGTVSAEMFYQRK